METFGVTETTVDALRALPIVDGLSVEDQGLRQILHIQQTLGAEAVPQAATSALEGTAGWCVMVREPTLEDAYVARWRRQDMNLKNILVYWRTVLTVAEITLRHQWNDSFILFGIIVHPENSHCLHAARAWAMIMPCSLWSAAV